MMDHRRQVQNELDGRLTQTVCSLKCKSDDKLESIVKRNKDTEDGEAS